MKFQRAAEVKRKKAQRKDRRANFRQAKGSTEGRPGIHRDSNAIPALLAAGLIGYFGDIEELRTDMQPFL